MKSLKFRRWDKHNDRFIMLGTNHDLEFWFGGAKMFPEEPLSKAHLEQYTGIKDKAGKEVFEGDIIKYHNAIENGIGEIKSFFGSNNLHCVWTEQNTTSPSLYTSIDYLGCPSEIEIIGNIHEKPEPRP